VHRCERNDGAGRDPGIRRARVLYAAAMRRHRFEIGFHPALLLVCAVALAALVYSEGWIWPLKAAAVMIPVSLLIS
jgi:hypothetical protein